MTSHTGRPPWEPDELAESLTGYALGALDRAADRQALEAHLEECAFCRDELSALRGAVAAIGAGVTPETPPAALRARVLTAATREPQRQVVTAKNERAAGPGAMGLPVTVVRPARASASWAWLAAAAAVAVAIGASLYAFSLRRELDAVRVLASTAAARAETLRTELLDLRRQSAELVHVLNVIGAPDVQRASLAGLGPAEGAVAHAYWSRSQGLVFKALRLPQLGGGRDYQLWIVPPAGGAPESLGVLRVRADGSSSHSAPLTSLPAATAVAITIEPAGGSRTPTMPIVMVGTLGQ